MINLYIFISNLNVQAYNYDEGMITKIGIKHFWFGLIFEKDIVCLYLDFKAATMEKLTLQR